MSTTISIPGNFTHGDELIVVRRSDYEQMQKRIGEVDDALEKIRCGERELRKGKTIVTTKSLSELRKRKRR